MIISSIYYYFNLAQGRKSLSSYFDYASFSTANQWRVLSYPYHLICAMITGAAMAGQKS